MNRQEPAARRQLRIKASDEQCEPQAPQKRLTEAARQVEPDAMVAARGRSRVRFEARGAGDGANGSVREGIVVPDVRMALVAPARGGHGVGEPRERRTRC